MTWYIKFQTLGGDIRSMALKISEGNETQLWTGNWGEIPTPVPKTRGEYELDNMRTYLFLLSKDISLLFVLSTIRLLLTSIIESALPCSEIELTITILPILRNSNLILYS